MILWDDKPPRRPLTLVALVDLVVGTVVTMVMFGAFAFVVISASRGT